LIGYKTGYKYDTPTTNNNTIMSKDSTTDITKKVGEIVEKSEYICASCGTDVKLKPREIIKCGTCGHRIVYKKRGKTPSQYLCR